MRANCSQVVSYTKSSGTSLLTQAEEAHRRQARQITRSVGRGIVYIAIFEIPSDTWGQMALLPKCQGLDTVTGDHVTLQSVLSGDKLLLPRGR